MVALRKESVDRNFNAFGVRYRHISVALRKESVDRNTSKDKNTMQVPWSLSARRAWIEMPKIGLMLVVSLVSLSARRAWIEISVQCRLKLSK